MAGDNKNIPDAGKADEPPKPVKVEPVKAAPPVQDQPSPVKTEAPAVEGTPKVVTPPAAEAPKDKDIPAPSKEGTPPGKDEKQITIPGMGDPAPAGKVVDFTAVREEAAKGKLPEKTTAPDNGKQVDKVKDAAKPRRGRISKADKAAADKVKPQPRDKMSQSSRAAGCTACGQKDAVRCGAGVFFKGGPAQNGFAGPFCIDAWRLRFGLVAARAKRGHDAAGQCGCISGALDGK